MARKKVLTPEIVTKLLARPEDFLYSGDNELMFKTWSLGPVINHRDATDAQTATGQRKLAAIAERFTEGTDYRVERHSHWLVGWVEHVSYRVLNTEGDPSTVTPIAKWMHNG